MAAITTTSPELNDSRIEEASIQVGIRAKEGSETLADRVVATVVDNEIRSDGISNQRTLTFSINDANVDLTAVGWLAGDAAEYRRLNKLLHDAYRTKLGH